MADDLFNTFSPVQGFQRRTSAWLGRQTMPDPRSPEERSNRQGQIQQAIQGMVADSNRADTAEQPWRGQLDPFGDM